MKRRFITLAIAVSLLALPALASGDCPRIDAWSAGEGRTGEPVTLEWYYDSGLPNSQTLSGHDFPEPVILQPGQTSYTYVPELPGMKHAQLAAVTDCGTQNIAFKYRIEKCPVADPVLTVSPTSVRPGEIIDASVEIPPGHQIQWFVTNGTPSATTGKSIQITAGNPGTVFITAVAWKGAIGAGCFARARATVTVTAGCEIQEPEMYVWPAFVTPNEYFELGVFPRPGETYAFQVRNAQVLFTDSTVVGIITPASGSFEIDVIVSNGTCTRTFTQTIAVQACTATATVSAGAADGCGATTAVAEFTGTAPFQGSWSDGQYFFTYDSRIERTVQTAGTYTLVWFRDNWCYGTISGSAAVGASLPTPAFALDEVVDGWYYGTDTCPGMVRTVRLTTPIPADAEVVWSVENGTIIAGQGTDVLQFAGTNPGSTTVSVVFRNAAGCTSQPYSFPYILTHGAPAFSVSVEPATIQVAGTAIVTVNLNPYVRGWNLTSSLGDGFSLLDSGGDVNGSWSTWEYRSTHGGGVATITASGNNACGQSASASTTLTIEGGPVGALATVTASGSACGEYRAVAEFTGIAPFSGTWSNGETFVTNDPYAILFPTSGGTYTLTSFSDANGAGSIIGSATFEFEVLPRPEVTFDGPANGCPNTVVTATLAQPLPEGGSASWSVYGGTILSGQGTGSIQIQTGTEPVQINVRTFAPGACSVEWGFAYLDLSCGEQPTAMLTSTPDALCGANVTATFTGTPPFSGTWNDGQTFTTSDSTLTRNVNWSQYVWLTSLADATRSDGYSNSVFAEATLPPYIFGFAPVNDICIGGTTTAQVVDFVPEGMEVVWTIEGTAARIVSGQGTRQVVIEGVELGQFILSTRLRVSATGCEGASSGSVMNVVPEGQCPLP